MAIKFINYPVKDRAYIPYPTDKTHIVLHSTMSRTKYTPLHGDGRDIQIADRWDVMEDKASLPYVVARNGTAYKIYPDENWSYQLFIPGNKNAYDKRVIGIGLANEGALEVSPNKRYFAFGSDKSYNQYNGPVFEKEYRGFNYWAAMDQPQIEACADLIEEIALRNKIDPVFYSGEKYDPRIWNKATIFVHSVVNDKVLDFPVDPRMIETFKQRGIKII